MKELLDSRIMKPVLGISETYAFIRKSKHTLIQDNNIILALHSDNISTSQAEFNTKIKSHNAAVSLLENPQLDQLLCKLMPIQIKDVMQKKNRVFELMVKSNDRQVYMSQLFKAIVRFKWEGYAKQAFRKEFWLYIFFLILFSTYCLLVYPQEIYVESIGSEDYNRTFLIGFFFRSLIILYMFYWIYLELIQV